MPPPGQDYYDVLGVRRDTSQEEIRQAYRKLVRTYHPDLNKDPGAEDRFKDISEAYSVLSDPATRARYDAFGPDFRQVPEDVDPDTWRRAGAASGAGRAGWAQARPGRVSGSTKASTWTTCSEGSSPAAAGAASAPCPVPITRRGWR